MLIFRSQTLPLSFWFCNYSRVGGRGRQDDLTAESKKASKYLEFRLKQEECKCLKNSQEAASFGAEGLRRYGKARSVLFQWPLCSIARKETSSVSDGEATVINYFQVPSREAWLQLFQCAVLSRPVGFGGSFLSKISEEFEGILSFDKINSVSLKDIHTGHGLKVHNAHFEDFLLRQDTTWNQHLSRKKHIHP